MAAARDSWLRTRGFTVAASALALVLIVSASAMFLGITAVQRQQQLVNSARASLITLGDLRAAVGEAEATADEYVLSNGKLGSQAYQTAQAHVSSDVRLLHTPQGLGSDVHQDITRLPRLTSTYLADLQSVLLLAQAGQMAAAAQRLSAGDVEQAAQSLRGVITRIQVAENGLARALTRSADQAQRLLIWIGAGTALLDIGAFVVICILFRRTSALREQSAQDRARAEEQAHIEALEITTQRMKDFLEIASHEIRTPLTSLKIALQLTTRAVQRVSSAAQQSAHQFARQPGNAEDTSAASLSPHATLTSLASVVSPLNRAIASTEQLERLVADLVDSARIEAHTLTMRPSACDLGLAVEDCVNEQRLYHAGRVITWAKPDDAVIVVADRDRIRQVVTNYLNNAHKFSEEHYPIEVKVSADAWEATVSVRDFGSGIPPEEQSYVWDQFYRAPGIGHLSGSSEGFGLGLYICATIIEQHGGKVGVASALGQGSTFWFSLPLANVSAKLAASPIKPIQ